AVDECLHDLGVREVPLLLLSHDHADHVDGVPGVLRHRTVGAVMGPEGVADSAAGRLLAEAGIEMMMGVVGQELRVGPWYLRVLWPEAGFTGSVNDGSLVVRADGPLSVLLTGDIEEDAQQRLLRSPDADLLSVGVLTTPHHGAATQEPGFLATTEPHVTVTSAGEDNSYGHPAPSTWNTLERVGAVNLRTDRDGAVAVPRVWYLVRSGLVSLCLVDVASPSLFCHRRIVVLLASQDLSTELSAMVTDCLRAPADDVAMVLTHAGGAKGKALLQAALEAGAHRVDCKGPTKPAERVSFVRGEFSAAGRQVTTDAARALVDAVGSDLREIAAA